MIQGIYTAVQGMTPMMQKQDQIASNLANANTTGFKQNGVFIRSYQKFLENDERHPFATQEIKSDQVYVDYSEGTPRKTGGVLDLMIKGSGFKRTRVEFQDLMYQTLREPGLRNPEGGMSPAGIEIGLGTRPAATLRIFEQGSLKETGNALDITIEGDGFFPVYLPDGGMAYTRDGQFKLSSDGTVVTSSGYPVTRGCPDQNRKNGK
jgi:flagellar basal body rod protein FlgG